MGSLAQRVMARQRLWDAWELLCRREGVIVPESALGRFSVDASERVDALAAELASGEYEPKALWWTAIPKSGGRWRTLSIPAVRDRVVERAVVDAVIPHVDPRLGQAAYAFRPGLGVADAVSAVVDARERGFGVVLHADIHDCFESCPRQHGLRLLEASLPDDSLNPLVRALVERPLQTPQGRVEMSGFTQGTALSPMLCNLTLTMFDEPMVADGWPLIRYADDFVVACRTTAQAQEALARAGELLKGMGMTLAWDKSEITTFDDGFSFLGEDFGPRYPMRIDARAEEPEQVSVYCGAQGGRVRVQKGRVIVTSKDDEEKLNVLQERVARLVLAGGVGLSAGARSWALTHEVDVVLLSRKGNYLGTMLPLQSRRRIARLEAQLGMRSDEDRRMVFAREVVRAKLRHQVTVLRRFVDPEDAEQVQQAVTAMNRYARMGDAASTAEELMGLEGAAAKEYWQAFATLLPEGVEMTGRTRRPPRDVVNAALSYGYALLLGECTGALAAAGLDPAVGLLHAVQDARPSLALDLMEEFRPYVVDQSVLRACRVGSLTSGHGRPSPDQGGVWLTNKGKDVLVDVYEKRMLTRTRGALPGFAGTLRRHLFRQAERLAAVVCDEDAAWTGLSWR